jgi:hypothetical protein
MGSYYEILNVEEFLKKDDTRDPEDKLIYFVTQLIGVVFEYRKIEKLLEQVSDTLVSWSEFNELLQNLQEKGVPEDNQTVKKVILRKQKRKPEIDDLDKSFNELKNLSVEYDSDTKISYIDQCMIGIKKIHEELAKIQKKYNYLGGERGIINTELLLPIIRFSRIHIVDGNFITKHNDSSSKEVLEG